MGEFRLRGAIFDLDGVITATARSHFRAWKATFEGFLRETGKDESPTFTYEEDYIPYVDGKPRYNGVQSFLHSRDVELPWGDPGDEPGNDTVCAVGNRKNEEFRKSVEKDGVDLYDSTLEMVKGLKERGVRVGVASSSKNTGFVLKTVGLSELFETVVDGVVSAELDLEGKPAPDIFVVAAERLGLEPKECMMVEDAYAGVEAGLNGNFALVLGVNREGGPQGLYARGADIVVSDLAEISLDDIDDWFREGIDRDSWNLSYHGFKPEEERLREALTTVGNGYLGVRGAYVGTGIDGDVHYPGSYIAGLYNLQGTEVEGRTIYNNDFVNTPNWLRVDCIVHGGKALRPTEQTVTRWEHRLDMESATTGHLMEFKDEEGRETRIESNRFVSMDSPHLAVLDYTVTPLNYSGNVTIRSALDGDVINYGVERYRPLESKHLEAGKTSVAGEDIRLESRTNRSKITISLQAHNELYVDERLYEGDRSVEEGSSLIAETFSLQVSQGRSYRLEKIVWIATDRPWPIEERDMPKLKVLRYHELLASHRRKWRELWDRADMVVDGDRFVQRVSRLHVYHLLATASVHNDGMDVGLPARGLHGEAYRGHVFWDELYIAPFFNRVLPQVTRSHLLYRYRRLEEAREIARDAGYGGALYPWQSADTGERESQQLHYNPRSGEWDPDLSHLQRHISIVIAHNIWEYHFTTGDDEFMHQYGMEMLLEIARFWASAAEKEETDERYHITGVMGPDEFHEKYPDASYENGGFKDNAYTNVMVAWLLRKVGEEYRDMNGTARQRLAEKIGFQDAELELWREIARGLAVVMDDQGILSQFDGYRRLKELDRDAYREQYDDTRRMDRILKAEGDSPDNYQISKQADTLMIWYILTPQEAAEVLKMMGYSVDDPYRLLRRNYEYYRPRTSHGSTLSYVVHSALLTYLPGNETDGWCWFLEAMRSDIYDTQGGTTLEGIHCGVMAGSLQIIVDNFAGLKVTPEEVVVMPELPKGWEKVSFLFRYRGEDYTVTVTSDRVRVVRHGGPAEGDERGEDGKRAGAISIRVDGSGATLEPGKEVTLEYEHKQRPSPEKC